MLKIPGFFIFTAKKAIQQNLKYNFKKSIFTSLTHIPTSNGTITPFEPV